MFFLPGRLLENELQRVQKVAEQREKELRQNIEELKNDNERQQKLIGQVGSTGQGHMEVNSYKSALSNQLYAAEVAMKNNTAWSVSFM